MLRDKTQIISLMKWMIHADRAGFSIMKIRVLEVRMGCKVSTSLGSGEAGPGGCLWAYGFGCVAWGVLLWAHGFGRMALGVCFGRMNLGVCI